MNETRERKNFTFVMAMSRAQADELDVWAFNHRIHSRAEAIRHLCRVGMAADSAVLAERERCASKTVMGDQTIRLHMGEMTAQEMRSVKAALKLVAALIREGE